MEVEKIATKNEYTVVYLNEAIITTVLFLYSLWRISKTKKTSDPFKEKLRKMGSFFIVTSLFFSSLYSLLLTFLSFHFDIDKTEFEIIGFIQETYNIRGVNLFSLFNLFYKASTILRVSSLFIMVGLLGPYAYSSIKSLDVLYTRIFKTKDILHSSVITFSKIYAIIRIPVLFIYYYQSKVVGDRVVFYENLFYGVESFLAAFFLILLKSKYGFLDGMKALDNTSLLSYTVAFYSVLSHFFNILAFPFALDEFHFQILQNVLFTLKIAIALLTVTFFCPLREQIYEEETQEGLEEGEGDSQRKDRQGDSQDDSQRDSQRKDGQGYSQDDSQRKDGQGDSQDDRLIIEVPEPPKKEKEQTSSIITLKLVKRNHPSDELTEGNLPPPNFRALKLVKPNCAFTESQSTSILQTPGGINKTVLPCGCIGGVWCDGLCDYRRID